MGHNLLNCNFNLFDINHKITPSNSNVYVAFQSLTIVWNLNWGYKTKGKTLPPEKVQCIQMKKRNWLCQWKYVDLILLYQYMFF